MWVQFLPGLPIEGRDKEMKNVRNYLNKDELNEDKTIKDISNMSIEEIAEKGHFNKELAQAIYESEHNIDMYGPMSFSESNDWLDNLNEDLLFEMSTVASKRTGLSHSIWLDDAAASRDIQHSKYRIKYGNNIYSSVVIKFFNNPVTENDVIGDVKNTGIKDIAKVIEWVNLNRDILIKYYDTEDHNLYDISDFISEMKVV